jgi:hypothetical protein
MAIIYRQRWWGGVLTFLGLCAMIAGTLDPLEGCLVILLGCAAVTLGAFLTQSRYRVPLFWASVLIAAGVGSMVVFTMMGGIGGHSSHSAWWGLLVLPYPVGWFVGLVGGVLRLMESFRRSTH